MTRYTEAQKKAIQKYRKEKTESIVIYVQHGEREKIKSHAEKRGMSMNQYILDLIQKDMNT